MRSWGFSWSGTWGTSWGDYPVALSDSAVGTDALQRQGSLLYGAPGRPWRKAAAKTEQDALQGAPAEQGSLDPSAGSDALSVEVSVALRDLALGDDALRIAAYSGWQDRAVAADAISARIAGGAADAAQAADLLDLQAQADAADAAFGASCIGIERRLSRHVIDDQTLMFLGVF